MLGEAKLEQLVTEHFATFNATNLSPLLARQFATLAFLSIQAYANGLEIIKASTSLDGQ